MRLEWILVDLQQDGRSQHGSWGQQRAGASGKRRMRDLYTVEDEIARSGILGCSKKHWCMQKPWKLGLDRDNHIDRRRMRRTRRVSRGYFRYMSIRRRQPRGLYYFGDWSAGGFSAFDAAQQEVSRLIFLDSPFQIGLDKLPPRLYDFFQSIGMFGTASKVPRTGSSGTSSRSLIPWTNIALCLSRQARCPRRI